MNMATRRQSGDSWIRAFDVGFALAGLTATAPILPVLALAVRLGSPGPVLYRATRVGRDGVPFQLYKFRTMVVDAANQGPGITGRDDPRVTRVGRIMRRAKLDELPQLYNVLRGDMAVVGPRPEDPLYVAIYTDEQREMLAVRPGLTSLAVLAYANESETLGGGEPTEDLYVREVMPAKLALDLEYVRTRTLWLDLRIVFRTARAVARPRPAPHEDGST